LEFELAVRAGRRQGRLQADARLHVLHSQRQDPKSSLKAFGNSLMLDLRIPSGLFFAAVGLILCGLGIFSPGARAALTDVNVNLYSGLVMLSFGALLLVLARRSV